MGIWFRSVALADGEKLLYQQAANSFRGVRSIGGQVTVTDRRVIFTPNRLDALTGGHQREVVLAAVREVRTLAPGRKAVKKRGFDAAFRRQIEIDDGSDPSLVVTVHDPDELVGLLPH